MDHKRKKVALWVVGGALATALATGASGIAVASGADDSGDDKPITGEALQRASAAALVHTHGGKVTETEDGDEESRYEVEVRLPDGRSVDVQLDENFRVVGDRTEPAGADDSDKN